jgi:hypothetical protein
MADKGLEDIDAGKLAHTLVRRYMCQSQEAEEAVLAEAAVERGRRTYTAARCTREANNVLTAFPHRSDRVQLR